MKADLVLVSHNSKADLEKFLSSIEANTKNYSLVIIDNGSAEQTTEYLKKREEFVKYGENRGYGAACNEGVKCGNSDFVVFLNSDLEASKNWLVDLLKPFEDSAVAVAGARLFSPGGREYPTPKEGWACGACFAVRRKIFEELGGFDENFFLFFEETDFCQRALTAGYKVIRSEARLVHFHPNFPPLSPELQKYWDKSEKYFKEKHGFGGSNPTLALVMIVKNEEVGLERAILSCRDFVQEIVIAVDNSSTDKTLEIAQKYATRIKHFDWQDDFSKARNFAHEGVKSDWILMLDGHEYVAQAPDLEKHLMSKYDGLMVAIEMESKMTFGYPRIYRAGRQFRDQVHERQDCRSIGSYPEFLIKHDRLGGQSIPARTQREKQRSEQVPRLMNAAFRKNKRDVRASFHLALFEQSHDNFRGAIRWWNRYLKYSRDKGERWFAFFNLSQCHFALAHSFRAFWYASRADDETAGRWEILKLKGLIFYQRGKFAKAAECFVASFSENTCIVSYKPWPRDISSTYNLIGECLFNQNIFDRASIAFARAAETCTDENLKPFLEKRAKLMSDIFKNQFSSKVA